jgi:hypothetical protein
MGKIKQAPVVLGDTDIDVDGIRARHGLAVMRLARTR